TPGCWRMKRLSMGDYVRRLQLPGDVDLSRRTPLALRLHMDIPLLLLLLLLTGFGLVVLYSASGKQVGAVIRQSQYFLLAFGVMFAAAQINLQRYQRWAPLFYPLALALLVAVMFVGVGA